MKFDHYLSRSSSSIQNGDTQTGWQLELTIVVTDDEVRFAGDIDTPAFQQIAAIAPSAVRKLLKDATG